MNVCAVDLGTSTGVAYNRGEEFFVETWKLATPREIKAWGQARLTRRCDPRVRRLCDRIAALGLFDIFIHEDCEFSTYRLQQQLWAAFRSAIWLCGEATHFECVNVQTLKKFAGARSQYKEAMSQALKRQRPDLWRAEYDDDAIDAIWLHLWAQQNLTRIEDSTIVKS